MNLKSMEVCTNCGVVICTEDFSYKEFPEGTNIYSTAIKEEFENKKGFILKEEYGSSYFFCPVCKKMNQVQND